MQARLERIVDASPGPVFVQAIGWHDPDPLVAQAKWLHNQSEKIIVKLPMSRAGIQALLRAQAGSTGHQAGGDGSLVCLAGVPLRQSRGRCGGHV